MPLRAEPVRRRAERGVDGRLGRAVGVGGPRTGCAARILLLTVFPVVVGLAAAGGYAMTSGLVRPVHIAPTLVVQLGIVVLFLAAYRRAAALARDGAERQNPTSGSTQ